MTTDKKLRKEMPIARGVLGYFPDAIAAVANVSFIGNKQHNGDAPMHWAREKSTDHADCIARHLIEAGTIDDDGMRHSAKMAWRSLALLQLEIEAANKDGGWRNIVETYNVNKLNEVCAAFEKATGNTEALKGTTATENGYEPVMFHGMPVQYVPHLDGTAIVHDRTWYWVDDIFPMVFTEAEPEPETDSRTEAPDDYLRRNDVAAVTPDLHRWRLCNVLENLGCAKQVIEEIVGGTSVQNSEQYVYIAGPMRGYDKFNFPAFDAARDEFLRNGWNVISPADIDRVAGCTEDTPPEQVMDQREFCYRDFYCLYLLANLGVEVGAIAMLPGWEKSTGAVAEFFLARWLGLKILDARSGQPLDSRGVNGIDLLHHTYKFLKGQK